MTGLINKFINAVSCLPDWLYTTLARYAVGMTFFLSGLTKVDDNYMVSSKTYSLFKDIYFARVSLPDALINILATIATYAELILPIMLFIGLGARFAALGLLIMTLVIQFVVFPGEYLTYHKHALWAVALLAILIKGAGPLSIDGMLRKS